MRKGIDDNLERSTPQRTDSWIVIGRWKHPVWAISMMTFWLISHRLVKSFDVWGIRWCLNRAACFIMRSFISSDQSPTFLRSRPSACSRRQFTQKCSSYVYVLCIWLEAFIVAEDLRVDAWALEPKGYFRTLHAFTHAFQSYLPESFGASHMSNCKIPWLNGDPSNVSYAPYLSASSQLDSSDAW